MRIDNRKAKTWELDAVEDSMGIDSSNLEQSLAELTRTASRVASVAAKTRALGAALLDLPNAYNTFADDPEQARRAMDSMRSFAYADFLGHRRQPERMIDLPMVKAVVRALDTITAFSSTAVPGGPATRFGIMGFSKLALATWMTAAADPRVEAIAPLALHVAFEDTRPPAKREDDLTMISHMYPHKPGLQKVAAAAQIVNGYATVLDSKQAHPERYEDLSRIVDPVRWAERLSLPKLWVMSSNDETLGYYTIDAPRRHIQQFPGPTSFLEVANCGHTDLIACALPSIIALFRGVLIGKGAPPAIHWELNDAEGSVNVRQTGGEEAPLRVRRWDASSGPFRDFVFQKFSSEVLEETRRSSRRWMAKSRHLSDGNASAALFVDALFEWPEPGFQFTVSTPVLVT